MNRSLSDLGALTLGAGIVILALLLLGRFTRRRYSARWRCLAWLLLSLRMAIPLSLIPDQTERTAPVQLPVARDPVIYQAPQSSPTAVPPPTATPDAAQIPVTPLPQTTPSIQPNLSIVPSPAQPEAPFTLSLSQLLLALWLAGCGGILLWNLFCHFRFCRWLKRWAVPVSDPAAIQRYNQLGDQLKLARRPRLLTCPEIAAPMLAGLLRPVILLPQVDLDEAALRFTLLHELTHFRRKDIWLKTLVLWVNALHWFNPLAWLMVRAVERDTELACDDAVLQSLPPEERAQYSRTILDTVSRVQTH